jgi:ERCC4-type nuclease
MQTHLILDVRESRLAEALTLLKVPFSTAALDVGDLVIQNAEGEPLLVAERKSHADFAASNADGRYREQRARLMAVRGSGVAVLYILEGIWTETEGKLYGRTNEAQLKRLTTRLILRYGLPVLAADSIMDTARWCRTLLAQLTDDPTVFQPESEAAAANVMSGFTAALNTVKKGNKTPGGTAHAMLSAVPGLGLKRVEALLAEKSLVELAAMTATDIADITAGGKRLGPALGTTLYECMRAKQP